MRRTTDEGRDTAHDADLSTRPVRRASLAAWCLVALAAAGTLRADPPAAAPDGGGAAAAKDEGAKDAAPAPEPVPTEADPATVEALKALMKAYRERPSLRVHEEVAVVVEKDGQEGEAAPRKADMMFAPGRKCVFTMNGYEFRYSGGKLWATHESNPDAYLEAGDDDSPYWSIVGAFTDVPFVSLALALGEEEPSDLVMTLHSRTPNVLPAKVSTVVEKDGAKRQHLVFLAEGERLELVVDPATMLVVSAEARVTGGDQVPQGGTLVVRNAIVSEVPAKPFDEAAFTLKPGKRKKVEILPELRKAEAAKGDAGGGAMVGKPAPEFAAASSSGGFVKSEDLAGRVVILDFWATWCGPCRAALPELEKLAQWVKGEQLPVVVYPVNVFEKTQGQERLQQVVAALQSLKISIPTLLDDKDAIATAFGVNGIPATFVLRADGIVHAQHVGFSEHYLETLKTEIRAAIEAVGGAAGGAAPAAGGGGANPPAPGGDAKPTTPER